MGTWGSGNFDSDGALDYVGSLMNRLVHTIDKCFEDNNADLDEDGEAELMPSVVIIKVLAEHCKAAPPKPDVIADWHKQYLAIYDRQIDDLQPVGNFKAERRAIIDATFTDLIELSQEFWSL